MSAIEPTDETLLDEWFKGEAQAFSAFYARHRGRVKGWLCSRGLAPGDADEVTQEVFLKLHASIAGYDPALPAMPWFFAIVRSTWLSWLRKESRLQGRSKAWASAEAYVAEPAPTPADDATVSSGEREARLRLALEGLEPQQRLLVERRFVTEEPYEAIAASTGKSVPALRKALERTLKALRRNISKEGEEL